MAGVRYQYDFFSIGDVALDTFVILQEGRVIKKKNKKYLALPFGAKLPVKNLFHALGGNAANVAIGANALGLKSSIVSIVGGDDTGERAFSEFKKHKLDSRYVSVDKKKKTNSSVILNLKGQRTILTFHEKRKYRLPKLPPSRFLYMTSMGQGCESMYKDILKLVKKNQTKLCFGPGSYQKKSGFKSIKGIIEKSFLYISNREEVEIIFKVKKNKTESEKNYIKRLLELVQSFGPENVIITDGKSGAYGYGEGRFYFAPIIDVPVIATTGAGDSFASGILSALAHGFSLEKALAWGTANSTSVIGEVGAQNGLLSRHGIKVFYQKYKNYLVQEF